MQKSSTESPAQLPPLLPSCLCANSHQLQQKRSISVAAHLALEQNAVRLGLVPVDIHHACERGVALQQARSTQSHQPVLQHLAKYNALPRPPGVTAPRTTQPQYSSDSATHRAAHQQQSSPAAARLQWRGWRPATSRSGRCCQSATARRPGSRPRPWSARRCTAGCRSALVPVRACGKRQAGATAPGQTSAGLAEQPSTHLVVDGAARASRPAHVIDARWDRGLHAGERARPGR